MKKVIQICHSYGAPFLDIARQYATTLTLLGFSVTTVYVKGKESKEVEYGSASDKVIFLKNSTADIKGLKLKQIAQLKDICQNESYLFAIAHRYKSIYIASHIKNLHVIGVHHCFGDYKRFTRRWHIYRHKKDITLLGVSNAVSDDLKSALIKLDASKIHTLHNRVSYQSLLEGQKSKDQARKCLKLPKNAYIFGNAGRLHKDKDQKTLIRAFAKVAQKKPNTYLVIMGEGLLETELKQLSKSLAVDDKVLFLGMIKHASNYFRAFDSFVLTSDREPFGMVLLEAMVAGIPIAIADCGGAPEVTGDTAFKFKFGDSEQLTEIMLKIKSVEDSKTFQLKKEMQYRVNQYFTDEASVEQFKSILKTIPSIQKNL